MNNTKNILLVAIITSTLVFGTAIVPMQSHASGENKKTGDFKSSVKANAEVDKKSENQKMDQDNFCYRDDDCQQASEGQQIVGRDNEANGFNDQSRNLQQQSVTPTATPTQPTTPTTGTLNICKTVINQVPGLTFLPSDFTFNFSTPANPSTFHGANEGCTPVTVAPGTYAFAESIPQFVTGFGFNITGGCNFVDFTSNPDGVLFNGTIAAGETQTCALSNAINAAFPGQG
jgi:Prealbumin-like fold domain